MKKFRKSALLVTAFVYTTMLIVIVGNSCRPRIPSTGNTVCTNREKETTLNLFDLLPNPPNRLPGTPCPVSPHLWFGQLSALGFNDSPNFNIYIVLM